MHTVVPLEAPFTVGISPSELCNFKCVYCNWGTPVGIPNATILQWNDFINIAKQVKDLYNRTNTKCRNLRLSGNGEPLLNPKIVDMVKYINDLEFTERIEITTNASLLTHDLTEDLLGAGVGLTRLIVSIQGVNSEKYREICGCDMDFDGFLRELRYFHDFSKSMGGKCKFHVKTLDIALNGEKEHEEFYEIFEPVCDTMNIENVISACEDVKYESIFPEFRKERTRYGIKYVERKCCDTLFYVANILPNGNVNTCGCKWPPHVIGNVYRNPLYEIWNCGQHKKEMVTHLNGLRKTLQDCRNCSSIQQYTMPEDNLDGYLNEILQRIEYKEETAC